MNRRLLLCVIVLNITTIIRAKDNDFTETENIDCKKDGFLPHPQNCRAFYWCSLRRSARAIILECEKDEIFDSQNQKCTYPWLSTREECGGTFHLKNEIETIENKARLIEPFAQFRNLFNGCTQEGFMGDENDCSKFYRCVDNGGGQYAKYDFSCAPGTVWDSDINSCNHAWAVKSKCGQSLNSSLPEQSYYPPTGEYNQNPVPEQPYPIKQPDNEYNPYPDYSTPIQQPQGPYTDQQGYNPSYPSQQPDEQKPPGLDQNQGEIDNPNPISQPPQGGYFPSNEYNPPQQPQEIPSSTYSPSPQPQPQKPGPSESNEQSSSAPPVTDNEINHSDSLNECKTEGFLPDSNDCRKFYRCVDNGKGSFIKYEFSCGQGTVWDPEINACNHQWAVKKDKCKYKVDQSGSEESNNSGNEINGATNGNELGNESSSKEPIGESSTSETNKENNSPSSSEQNSSSTTTEQNNSYSTSSENYPINNNNTSGSSTTETTTEAEKDNKGQGTSYECVTEDFIPDKKDCKKFYRCVKNNKKGFIKYEFTCGEGTVWDSDAKTCNYPWATRSKCGTAEESSSNEFTNGTSTNSTENGPNKIDESTTSGISEQNNSSSSSEQTTSSSENSTSGSSAIEITTETEKDNKEQGTSNESNSSEFSNNNSTNSMKNDKCTGDGFIGDSKNCKKFYRCVDNGKGGFTKYEFTCGEGTIWDNEQSTCNYPWAVKRECKNENATENQENIDKIDETSSEKENIPSTGNEQNSANETISSTETNNSTYSEIPNNSSSNETDSSNTVEQQKNDCKRDGFIAHPNDCKKFNRCVDNGKGNYVKYEFSCGEGTVWDSELETCNYPWAVHNSKCGHKGTDNSQETSSSSASSTETYSTSTEAEHSTEQIEVTTNKENQTEEAISKPESSENSSEQSSANEHTTASTSEKIDESSSVVSTEQISTEKLEQTDHSSTQTSAENPSTEKPEITTYITSSEADKETQTEESNSKPQPTENSSENSSTNESTTTSTSEQTTSEHSTSTSEQTGSTDNSFSETNEIYPANQGGNSVENMNKCTKEGFFPNLKQCSKFYRCVSNGKGGFIKYDFDCGGGTIWDPDLDTCNHPYAVTNKKCEQNNQKPPTGEQKPKDQCSEGGYFPSNQDCKKFYRCVDNGKGQFTKHDFTCGEGTIWDPNALSCNYPWATENKACGHRGDNIPSTPEQEIKTEQPSGTSPITPIIDTIETTTSALNQTTGTEIGTSTTPNEQTTIGSQEVITTESQSQTTESRNEMTIIDRIETTTPIVHSTISENEKTTTSYVVSTIPEREKTTTESNQEVTTQTEPIITTTDMNEIVTSGGETTTMLIETTTMLIETTDSSSETTELSSESTDSYTESSSQTTESSSTSTDSYTESSSQTTESSSTSTDSASESTDSSTEGTQTVTSPSQEINQTTASCPISQLEGDQMALVCPTGFKRHPKYCNLFYQCTTNPDTFEINVLVISCPGRRIYDDEKIQCLAPEESDQECTGQIAEKEQFRKFGNSISPMQIESEEPLCPNEGNFPLNPQQCDNNFIKCERSTSRSMRGFMYKCPENFTYWPVSKKCERRSPGLSCEQIEQRRNIWQIPVEIEKGSSGVLIDVRVKDNTLTIIHN